MRLFTTRLQTAIFGCCFLLAGLFLLVQSAEAGECDFLVHCEGPYTYVTQDCGPNGVCSSACYGTVTTYTSAKVCTIVYSDCSTQEYVDSYGSRTVEEDCCSLGAC